MDEIYCEEPFCLIMIFNLLLTQFKKEFYIKTFIKTIIIILFLFFTNIERYILFIILTIFFFKQLSQAVEIKTPQRINNLLVILGIFLKCT